MVPTPIQHITFNLYRILDTLDQATI